tara:strand:- start:1573 stop:2154 length:582 start_codon:yes stop_codon:yes gene_type:complete
MSQICTLFPQFYYHGEVENHQQLKDKLLSELTVDKLSQPKEWNCSVQSSFETDNNFSWDYFYECIKPNLLDMHQQLKGNPLHQFNMTEAWLNKYERGDSQEVHTHIGADNTTFSCSYFAQYAPNDARFLFYDPDQTKHLGEFSKHYGGVVNTWFPDVQEGDIIIFPSWIHHQVEPHRSDTTRITVSANFKVTS